MNFIKTAKEDLNKDLHQSKLNQQKAEMEISFLEVKLSQWEDKLEIYRREERQVRDFIEKVKKWETQK